MSTIPLHPEYASSSIRRPVPSRSLRNETHKDNSTASPELDLKKESLIFGITSDVIKNVGKIMTGSLFTDLLKGILKDKNQTWEEVLYSTLVDSGPSRFFTDIINAFSVRFLSFLPPELSSQVFASPSVVFFRAATSKHNVNNTSAKNNMSPEEEELFKEVQKKPFVKWVNYIGKNFQKHIKPKLDVIFQKTIGVKAGQALKDKNGNFIYNAKGKKIISNPIVNLKHLLGMTAAFLFGTMLLPRHTKSTGQDSVKTPLRAMINTISTTLFRLNTTLLHNGVGPHKDAGANFDKCYDTSVKEKTLVPLVQYTSDNIGALLSKHIKMNGAILGIIARLITEIPSTFLTAGLITLSKGDRLSDEWKILGQRMWLPVIDNFQKILKPFYKTLAKHGYSKFLGGMYDPKIKNMYDVSIGNNKFASLDPELDKKFKKGFIPTFALFVKEVASIFIDLPTIFSKAKIDSDIKRKMDVWVQKSVNRRIDFENKYGFKAPTHQNEELKSQLTDEQREYVAKIERKELSRGFKMVWDQENQSYKKEDVKIESMDDNEELENSQKLKTIDEIDKEKEEDLALLHTLQAA